MNKKKHKMRILIVFILLILFSCQNKHETELNKEINFINEIFLPLSNELSFRATNFPVPPPKPPPGYDFDTIRYNKWKNEYDSLISSIDYDTSVVVLAVNNDLVNRISIVDTIRTNPETYIAKDFHTLIKTFNRKGKLSISLDLKLITETEKYKLKSISSFPKKEDILREKHDFNFGGILVFSRVYFNHEYNKAIFYCEYICCYDGGAGYVFFAKKIDSKWKIIGKQMAWIS